MSIQQTFVDARKKIQEEFDAGLLTSIEYTTKEFAIKKAYRDSMSKARKRIIYNR